MITEKSNVPNRNVIGYKHMHDNKELFQSKVTFIIVTQYMRYLLIKFNEE